MENTITAKKEVGNHLSTTADPNSGIDDENIICLEVQTINIKSSDGLVKINSVPIDMIILH